MKRVSAAPRVWKPMETTLKSSDGYSFRSRASIAYSTSSSWWTPTQRVSSASNLRLSRIQKSIGRPTMFINGLGRRYPSAENLHPRIMHVCALPGELTCIQLSRMTPLLCMQETCLTAHNTLKYTYRMMPYSGCTRYLVNAQNIHFCAAHRIYPNDPNRYYLDPRPAIGIITFMLRAKKGRPGCRI